MMKRTGLSLALLLILTGGSPLCPAREWVDATGKFRVEADFVEAKGEMVTLRTGGGETIEVPLERLSAEDRNHIVELLRRTHADAAAIEAEHASPWIALPPPRHVLKYDRSDVSAMRLSRDGRWLACNSASQGIEVWDLANRRIVHALRHAHPGREVGFDFSPNGRTLVAARGNVFMGWEVATGKLLFRDESLEVQPPIDFSPDGKWLAAGGFDANSGSRFLQVIDVATMKRMRAIAMDSSPLGNLLAFSPDGKRLAVGVNTGKDERQVDGGVSFTPVSYVKLHAIPSLQTLARSPAFDEEDHMVTGVTYSDNGKQVIATSLARVLMHDARSGRPRRDAASPEGQFSVSSGTELVTLCAQDGEKSRFAVWHPSTGKYLVRWMLPSWPAATGKQPLVELHAANRQVVIWDSQAKEIRIYSLPRS